MQTDSDIQKIIIIIIIIVVSDLNKTKQNGIIIIQHVKPKGNSPIISRNLKSYTFAYLDVCVWFKAFHFHYKSLNGDP